MFRLRDYEKKDFEQLFKLDQQCFAPGIAYSRAELSSYIERKHSFTIVADLTNPDPNNTKIAGFVTVEVTSKSYGHVITIDARKEHRRQGLGSLLLEAAEKKVRDMEGFMMALEVAVDNEQAITFYKKHKYKILKTLPRYYADKLDGLLMTKRL